MASGRAHTLRLLLTILVVGGSLIFLGVRFAAAWRTLAEQPPAWDWRLLGLAVVAALPWFALRVRLWQEALRTMGGAPTYRRAASIWSLSELGRYLPGAGMHLVGRAIAVRWAGWRAAHSVVASLLELAVTAMAAGVLALGLAGGSWGIVSPWGPVLATLLLLGTWLALHRSSLWVPLVNRLLIRVGRQPIGIDLTPGAAARLMAISLAAWVSLAGSFVIFLSAIKTAGSDSSMLLFGSSGVALGTSEVAFGLAGQFAVAWLIGMAVIVAPAGIGVRETVLATLLTPSLGAAPALVAALASRLWLTTAELLFVGLSLLSHDRERPR